MASASAAATMATFVVKKIHTQHHGRKTPLMSFVPAATVQLEFTTARVAGTHCVQRVIHDRKLLRVFPPTPL